MTQTDKPTALRVLALSIPKELMKLDQWVLWRYEHRDGHWTKVPRRATRLAPTASSMDSSTWSSFEQAVVSYDLAGCDGIGFVVTVECGIVGIDLDHCRDPKKGKVDDRAERLIKRFDSYTEVSPSGTGIRIFVRGVLPEGPRKVEDYEVYASGRYLTVTGHHIEGTSTMVEERSEVLAEFVAWLRAKEAATRPPDAMPPHRASTAVISNARLDTADADLIACASRAKNGADFDALWRGDIAAYDNDDSRADLALCDRLAFWTGKDPLAMDRLFRLSGLYREKWDRDDYRERTISKAINDATEVYQPSGQIIEGEPDRDDSAPKRPGSAVGSWPQPIGEAAFIGLAGEIVNLIAPHSEASREAILIQFLDIFGNVVGHAPYFPVENDRHTANIDVLLVGETSAGRKGTSFGQARRPFDIVFPNYVRDNIDSGLSSGEGLINRVRDPVKTTIKGERVVTDPGITDKRLLMVETEFASVLRVMERDGNTLSPKIRLAWDHGNLGSVTKQSPVRATGAHVSIIGHVTRYELLRCLTRTEVANGFANRFLIARVKRSKELPDGGNLDETALAEVARKLKEVILKLEGITVMKRDDEAKALWRREYHRLSLERPGMLGTITGRGAAHVVRLSVIYALLDGSSTIRVEHLRAALEVWRYCYDSARSIFGDSLGDPVADTIVAALRTGKDGLTQTEISNLFGRNRGKDEIVRSLAMLEELGLAKGDAEPGSGRPPTRWRSAEAG